VGLRFGIIGVLGLPGNLILASVEPHEIVLIVGSKPHDLFGRSADVKTFL